MDDYKYTRILQAAMETPWAILPGKLAIIRDLLRFRAGGGRLSAEEVRARLSDQRAVFSGQYSVGSEQLAVFSGQYSVGSEQDSGGQAATQPTGKIGAVTDHELVAEMRNGTRAAGGGAIAVIPIVGTIIPRADMLAESSGAVSLQRFRAAFRAALNDPEVGSIVLDVDSPGGQVDGVPEMGEEIFRARAGFDTRPAGFDTPPKKQAATQPAAKRIVAVANTLAASAAYWLATAADELVVSPSAEVGSIGVFAMHEDVSKLLEMEGVAVSLISAGKYKIEGNPFEALGEEARRYIQGRVDEYYEMFISAVARNRGVKKAEVRGGFGEGRVVGAREAVQLGMADRVGTLDEVVQKLAGGRSRRSARAGSSSSSFEFRKRKLRLEAVSVETGVLVKTVDDFNTKEH